MSLTSTFDSALEIDFLVEYSVDPADPDVGIFTTEMIIERVMVKGLDILPVLSDAEVSILEDQAYDDWSDDGSAEADYRYEEMKDKLLDEIE